MDAVEFIKIRRRMVLSDEHPSDIYHATDPENLVAEAERFARNHLVRTRMSELLREYPKAEIGTDGLPAIGPCQLNTEMLKCGRADCVIGGKCDKCRRDFWLEEIENGEV